ncbi:uncharacterized protein N7496_008046 [Penicillium cataractarum]|uniref:Uncharacterized protein n=1 Tax=Penicillium cataractarum TaxID=2100454 RepID=A0A9W9RY13_9EURO|nr:uncharacterized protein N7496_008046 [Penicillium cataractarum]KAJ5368286.1 hypothetical protein N7496_008046 [Penicillium cataractarum]
MAPEPKPAEADRLNALQMADLGTARREHISTADDTRRRVQADMETIEMRRPSNIAGSVENQRAERNRGSLDAWTSFHTTVTDTGTREQLDDLMQGQTHRAQLSATQTALRESELTRQRVGGHARARSVSHVSSNHPYPRPSSGRGGGIIGTRSRHQISPSRRTFDDFPTRQDPALDINNPGEPSSRPFRGQAVHRGPGNRVSHASFRARVPETRPRRSQPIEDYAARLAPPDDFMASIRAPSSPSTGSATTPTRQPQRAITIPKTLMAPKTATAPKPAMTSKRGITANPAPSPKPVARSALDDSIYAISASSTPAGSATKNRSGSQSSARRIVPFEKTAAFSSREKAARSKTAGEQQEESKGKKKAPVLLEFDQDAQESVQVQLRNLLLSPDMVKDLTGITFPTGDESASGERRSQLQEYFVEEILQMIENCSERMQERAGPHGQPTDPLQVLTEFKDLDRNAISRRVAERLSNQEMALEPLRQGQEEMQLLEMATPPLPSAMSQDERPPLPMAGPSTPRPKQVQNIEMPKTDGTSAKRETDQVSKTGSFDNYRTPQRSASASATDSSDEKKQRRIDASLLSPRKTALASDIPGMQFESLRLSEPRAPQNPSKEPMSLIDMDDDLTPTKEAIVKTTPKPILGLMEGSIFAAPMDKADTTSEENSALAISKAPRVAPGLGPVVARAQRPTLIQSSSNTLNESSAKGSSSSTGPRSSQQPPEKQSRAISGGMETSIWAHTDKGPSNLDPKVQTPPQQRPRAGVSSSRQSSMQSTSTEDTTTPKITFLGPAPYMPKRK